MSQSDIRRMIAQQTAYGLSRDRYIESLGWRPFAWQSQVLQSRHKRKLINGARQSGKSTIVSSVPCHTAKYYPKSLSIVLAPTEAQAIAFVGALRGLQGIDQQHGVGHGADPTRHRRDGSRPLAG